MLVYAKFIAALSGALGVAVSVTVDGSISLNDGFAIAAAGVGALAVGAIANAPKAP